MGVEPFLSASSVIAVMGQRLVRHVCPVCREPYTPLLAEVEELGLPNPAVALHEHTFYRAKGCPECFDSGYRGRLGIHELMLVGDEVRTMVMKNAPASQLKKVAMQTGMDTLREDGAAKVLRGWTTIDEVMRVTAEDS